MIEKKRTVPKSDAWCASRSATWSVRSKKLYVYDMTWVEQERVTLDESVSSIQVNGSETLLLASGWNTTWLVDLRASSCRRIERDALVHPFFYANDIVVVARSNEPLGAELRTIDVRTEAAISTLQILE